MLRAIRIALSVPLVALVACAKQEEAVLSNGLSSCASPIAINEVIASGSVEVNEFGDGADWLELYNAGSSLRMEAGEWYLTDDPEDPLKYELPGLVLREQEHLVIWCDGQDVVLEDIHASFHLAAEGEWLALVYSTAAMTCVVDSVRYPAQEAANGSSFGRTPDGTQAWEVLDLPTPGGPNEVPTLEP